MADSSWCIAVTALYGIDFSRDRVIMTRDSVWWQSYHYPGTWRVRVIVLCGNFTWLGYHDMWQLYLIYLNVEIRNFPFLKCQSRNYDLIACTIRVLPRLFVQHGRCIPYPDGLLHQHRNNRVIDPIVTQMQIYSIQSMVNTFAILTNWLQSFESYSKIQL